jgi:hypothetical protein
MIELVWGNGSNAPVRPCVYELAEKSKAVAIVDFGLHTAQSIIIATEWLLAPSITADKMFSKPTIRSLIDKKLDKDIIKDYRECGICTSELAVSRM